MSTFHRNLDGDYRPAFDAEPASGHLVTVGVAVIGLFAVGVALIIRGLM
jgi:hypothetical protein